MYTCKAKLGVDRGIGMRATRAKQKVLWRNKTRTAPCFRLRYSLNSCETTARCSLSTIVLYSDAHSSARCAANDSPFCRNEK